MSLSPQVDPAHHPTLQIQENLSLAPHTTLGVGGPARFFVEVRSEPELLEALAFARSNSLPLFVLGGGSNVLIPDAGFPGLVLHVAIVGKLVSPRTAGAPFANLPFVDLTVLAGTPWDDLVLLTCQQGLSGMECLAGIPGLTGGTPVQNVGAYGQEVADTIHSVRVLDLHATPPTFLDLPHAACAFTYRSSIFNTSARGRYIVTAVTFRLSPNAHPRLTYADLTRRFAGHPDPSPLDIYHAVREIRRSKGMLLVPGDPDCASAGSFFKNPIVPASALDRIAGHLSLDPSTIPHWPIPAALDHLKLSAAWLVEQAGFPKGFTLGAAGISSRHSLALINRGHAQTSDLLALRDRIRAEVEHRFGIALEQEPVEPGVGIHLPHAELHSAF